MRHSDANQYNHWSLYINYLCIGIILIRIFEYTSTYKSVFSMDNLLEFLFIFIEYKKKYQFRARLPFAWYFLLFWKQTPVGYLKNMKNSFCHSSVFPLYSLNGIAQRYMHYKECIMLMLFSIVLNVDAVFAVACIHQPIKVMAKVEVNIWNEG